PAIEASTVPNGTCAVSSSGNSDSISAGVARNALPAPARLSSRVSTWSNGGKPSGAFQKSFPRDLVTPVQRGQRVDVVASAIHCHGDMHVLYGVFLVLFHL